MTDPDFLTFDDVLALHADRIEKYGGSLGLRDAGGLSSALGMASATFGGAFLHPTLAEMAAAYLFHISQAHAFVDGNKRVALAAALAFLALNGHQLVAEPRCAVRHVYWGRRWRIEQSGRGGFHRASPPRQRSR